MDTFKFPLVFNVNGIAVHSDTTKDYYAQLISNISLVEFGELPIRPDIGVPDVTFRTTGVFSPIVSAITRHIPEVIVTSVSQTDGSTASTLGTSTLTIDFEVINAIS